MLFVKVEALPTKDGARLVPLRYAQKKSLNFVEVSLKDVTAGMFPALTPYWATLTYVSDRIADSVQPDWATHVLFQ